MIFEDDRGFFFESFNKKDFSKKLNFNSDFVQDNHSRSSYGVLRGLHYQMPPYDQGKLVRVLSGKVFDVAVDIRKKSKTFGQWVSVILSVDNKKQIWIPPGFAHGFLVLSDGADVIYKTTNFYNNHSERSIIWNDPELNIDWPLLDNIKLSQKDLSASAFKDAEYFND